MNHIILFHYISFSYALKKNSIIFKIMIWHGVSDIAGHDPKNMNARLISGSQLKKSGKLTFKKGNSTPKKDFSSFANLFIFEYLLNMIL